LQPRTQITPNRRTHPILMRLHDIAHTRAGDKGDTSDISVISYRPEDYELLRTHLTAQRVADHFHGPRRRAILSNSTSSDIWNEKSKTQIENRQQV